MSTINLIPPQIKAQERNRKIFSLVFTFLIVLILMVAICYGALFALDYFAKEELAKTKQSLAEEQVKLKNLEQTEKQVTATNARLQKINGYLKNRILWSKVLTDLNNSTPEQLKLDSFSSNTTDKKLTISGAGESRRDIVKLQEKLGSLSYWTNVNFNASSYTETDAMYTFTMTGELKQ